MSISSRRPRRGQAPGLPERRFPLTLVILGGGVVALVAILGVAIYNTTQDRAIATTAIEGVKVFPGLDRGHQDGAVAYEQTPPVGGPHNAAWLNCGIYEEPVASEYAVHSLEHGAVWVTYRPDLPAEQVELLRRQVRGNGYVVLSPYPDLPSPVIASAWGIQLSLEEAGDPRLNAFMRKYQQGPQTPELGAACTQGVGTPSQR